MRLRFVVYNIMYIAIRVSNRVTRRSSLKLNETPDS